MHGTKSLGNHLFWWAFLPALLIPFTVAAHAKGTSEAICMHFALHYKLLIAGNMPFCLSSPTNIPSKWQRQWNFEWSNFQTLGWVRARLKCKSCIFGLPLTTSVLGSKMSKENFVTSRPGAAHWTRGNSPWKAFCRSEPKVSINIFKTQVSRKISL